MIAQFKTTIAAFAAAIVLSACSSYSAVEESFGDSAHNMVEQQQLVGPRPLAADEPLPTTDGRRTHNVLRTYQEYVGDPLPVVKEMKFEGGDQQ